MPAQRTYREDEVLAYIKRYERRHAQPPTIREIADALGLASTNAVYKYLSRLREQGRLAWEPRKHRALRVVGNAVR